MQISRSSSSLKVLSQELWESTSWALQSLSPGLSFELGWQVLFQDFWPISPCKKLRYCDTGSMMPEDLLCHSLPGSRRGSRGEGGVGGDGSAELPLLTRSRRRLFLVLFSRSALCARLSGDSGCLLLWFTWFRVTFWFLGLFTFSILFYFLIFYTEAFTLLVIIVTLGMCIEFFCEGWEDWKPDMLNHFKEKQKLKLFFTCW